MPKSPLRRLMFPALRCSIATCVFEDLSCVGLEIGNDISAILGVGNSGESHGVARSVISGGLEVLVQGAVFPGLALQTLQCARVGETLLRGGITSIGTFKVRASAVSIEAMADCAEVLENLLSFLGISSLLLLGSHHVSLIFSVK